MHQVLKPCQFRKRVVSKSRRKRVARKTGVDARIFRVMETMILCKHHIQGSSEGIGLVVAADKANRAMIELEKNLKMISILRMSIKLQLLTTFL
jgi:hypothetical protein